MTKLGLLNFFVLQWTGFRLARVITVGGPQTHWAVLGPVLPLTGWKTDYIGCPKVRVQFRTLKEWIEEKTVK